MYSYINLQKMFLIKIYTGLMISQFTNKRCLVDELQTRKVFSVVMGDW